LRQNLEKQIIIKAKAVGIKAKAVGKPLAKKPASSLKSRF